MFYDKQKVARLIDDKAIQTISDDLGVEVCSQLLQLFMTELQQLLDEIRLAIEQQNATAILRAVHILKNSAALYGANTLAFIASEIHNDPTLSPPLFFLCSRDLINIAEQTLQQYQARFIADDSKGNKND